MIEAWYPWTLERLRLEYRYQKFGMRNSVERFFRYLKERTMVFHHKMSARNYTQGIINLKPSLNYPQYITKQSRQEVSENAYPDITGLPIVAFFRKIRVFEEFLPCEASKS